MEVSRYYIVYIGSGYKVAHWQPHTLGQKAGRKVAEVATGHTKHDRISSGLLNQQLPVCLEIVKGLRDESGNVDGIGRAKPNTPTDIRIQKGLFYQCLAIVKGTVYFQRRYVMP
jgi:hypothetical protein